MTIHEVVAIAQRVHDAEGVNLGSASTRESRNMFWARAIGIVHHGHPTYNPTPDPQWHIKDGGGGRPQSDDVVVSLPSRQYWDCIPNAGADGYSFRASGPEILPSGQNVYPPPVPAGGGGVVTPPTGPTQWTAAHSARLAKLPANATTQMVAEDFAFAFPSETWGLKRADANRPISADVIARKLNGNLEGYKVVPKPAGAPQTFNLAGQVFVSVTAKDHVGGSVTPPVQPPVVVPPPSVEIPYLGDQAGIQIMRTLMDDYKEAGQPFNPGAGIWHTRIVHDASVGKMGTAAAIAKHRAEYRHLLGLPPAA